ncbi:MAG: tautomerase family protein [Rhizobacter sp.]|nr:tautomerase family protein [Chlorobiales bacterium]
MPLVTITLIEGRSAGEKKNIGDAIHRALVSSGVPEADRFQRFAEQKPENFLFDRTYPNLTAPRTEKFILIEILLSVGRSVKVKKQILKSLMEHLETAGQSPNDTMVVFIETTWENWAFANGEQIHI